MSETKMNTKRVIAGMMALLMVAGAAPANVGTVGSFINTAIVAHAADEVSENISLVASPSANLTTISGTHYSVSCGYMNAAESGMQVCRPRQDLCAKLFAGSG